MTHSVANMLQIHSSVSKAHKGQPWTSSVRELRGKTRQGHWQKGFSSIWASVVYTEDADRVCSWSMVRQQ